MAHRDQEYLDLEEYDFDEIEDSRIHPAELRMMGMSVQSADKLLESYELRQKMENGEQVDLDIAPKLPEELIQAERLQRYVASIENARVKRIMYWDDTLGEDDEPAPDSPLRPYGFPKEKSVTHVVGMPMDKVKYIRELFLEYPDMFKLSYINPRYGVASIASKEISDFPIYLWAGEGTVRVVNNVPATISFNFEDINAPTYLLKKKKEVEKEKEKFIKVDKNIAGVILDKNLTENQVKLAEVYMRECGAYVSLKGANPGDQVGLVSDTTTLFRL